MQADRQAFAGIDGSPMISKSIREFQTEHFGIESHRSIHVGNDDSCVAAGDHFAFSFGLA
jgi:hypothetical protein